MNDKTEIIRRERLAEINAEPGSRKALETQHGRMWDTQELAKGFEVIGFLSRKGGRKRFIVPHLSSWVGG
jgi:hypothetical protein